MEGSPTPAQYASLGELYVATQSCLSAFFAATLWAVCTCPSATVLYVFTNVLRNLACTVTLGSGHVRPVLRSVVIRKLVCTGRDVDFDFVGNENAVHKWCKKKKCAHLVNVSTMEGLAVCWRVSVCVSVYMYTCLLVRVLVQWGCEWHTRDSDVYVNLLAGPPDCPVIRVDRLVCERVSEFVRK